MIIFLGNSIGDCVVDSFSVSSPGNVATPVICGFNTKQHSNFENRLTPTFFNLFAKIYNSTVLIKFACCKRGLVITFFQSIISQFTLMLHRNVQKLLSTLELEPTTDKSI
jgi:hypothetical protein